MAAGHAVRVTDWVADRINMKRVCLGVLLIGVSGRAKHLGRTIASANDEWHACNFLSRDTQNIRLSRDERALSGERARTEWRSRDARKKKNLLYI